MDDENSVSTSYVNWSLFWSVIAFACVIGAGALFLDDQQSKFDVAHSQAMAAQRAELSNAEWRNGFWKDVVAPEGTAVTHDPKLVLAVHALFFRDGPLNVDVWTETVGTLSERSRQGSAHGVLNEYGLFTDASLRQIERLQKNGEWVPEPTAIQAEPVRADAVAQWLGGAKPLYWWAGTSVASYLCALIIFLIDGETLVPWFGITRVRGAFLSRGALTILYAPLFLTCAIAYGFRRAGHAAIRTPRQLADWWKTSRNPYRAQIRKARAARDTFVAENASQESIDAANATLSYWEQRHADETSANETERARVEREARLRSAGDTLIRLSTEAEVESVPGARVPPSRNTA